VTQPIEEGMVLGGRYLVTGHVLTSADQDMVLDGRDQVLNRDVSILVASSDHASQVAASARELATGERQGGIQVLDLGLSEGRTYLIAGGSPGPDDLLDMTREQQVYVEPFQTDTLGSEIFGEARTYEPHVYEDDEDYYEDLDDSFATEGPEPRRPRFLKGLSERLSQRLGSHDAARDAVSGAGATAAAAGAAAAARDGHDDGRAAAEGDATGGDPYRSAVRRTNEKPLPDTVSDDEWTGTHDEVTVDPAYRTPVAGSGADAAEESPRPGERDTIPAKPTSPPQGSPGRTMAHDRQPVPQDVRGSQPGGDDDPAAPRDRDTGASREGGSAAGRDHDTAADTGEVRRAGVVGGAAAGAAAGAVAAADAGTGPGTAATGTAATGAASTAGADATAVVPRPQLGRESPHDADVAPQRPKVSIWSDDEREDQRRRRDSGVGSAVPAAGLAAAAATAPEGAGRPQSAPDAGPTGPATSADREHDEDYDAFAEEEYQDEDKPQGARWILGGILALVLILGAVFAFNLLGNNREPQAGDGDSTAASPAGSPAGSQAAGSDLPEPVVTGAARLVPDNPQLSAETDNTLPNVIDGNPATAWQTYKFAQPLFGGYASSMALVIELEEPSAVNQVDIAQNNGSGGSFTVLLNDAPQLDGARQIAEGSFTGPQVSVPVSGEDGAPAEAQYVIINFTELPQLSNASANLPYGLRIAEVQVQ
jgi:hypothetical protein